MSRPLRIQFPGAVYHITARGNEKKWIFLDDEDRAAFLNMLLFVSNKFNWLLYSWCIMGNHYHLVIETADSNLSRGMKELNGRYTQRFNRKHNRTGHLFQGRYRSILIDKDNYLLEACRYVVLNPVRAGIVEHPGYWKWSSFATTASPGDLIAHPGIKELLEMFGGDKAGAGALYQKFVLEGTGGGNLWENLKGGIILGGDKFLSRVGKHIKDKRDEKEIPVAQRYVSRPSLERIFENVERNNGIRKAHREFKYNQKEIADFLGLHYSTVSVVLKRVV